MYGCSSCFTLTARVVVGCLYSGDTLSLHDIKTFITNKLPLFVPRCFPRSKAVRAVVSPGGVGCGGMFVLRMLVVHEL